MDAEGQRVLDIIRTNTQQMGQLIDDLLAFSRLGRRELKAANLDMGALVQDVVEKLQDPLEDRKVKWDLKPLPRGPGRPGLDAPGLGQSPGQCP